MAEYHKRLVSYKVSDVKTPNALWNYVEQALVLLPQDESTMQSNDGPKASWVPNGEQPLKKKGAGQGLHKSGVICSTVSYMPDTNQTIEYSKTMTSTGLDSSLSNKYIGYYLTSQFICCLCHYDTYSLQTKLFQLVRKFMSQVIRH